MSGLIESSSGFSTFKTRAENYLEGKFPNQLRHVDGIAIGRNKDDARGLRTSFKVTEAMQGRGMYMTTDSLKVKRYVANL